MGQTFSHFLKQSSRIPTPPLTEKNLPDQHGKVFIVTGSNTGVGYHVARILYHRNGTVYVAARTESKALDAIERIKESAPQSKGRLHFLKLDLSDLSTIKATAEEFLGKETRLDKLIQNAGVMDPPNYSKSAQGFELQYGTNVLGPFMLAKLLVPILKDTAALPDTPKNSVRVSWAGSVGVDLLSPKPGGLKFNEDGSMYDFKKGGPPAYASSKTANVFLGHEFGRRIGTKDGVLHNSFNPGNLKSELNRHAREKYGPLAGLANLFLYPAVMGAYTEIYAAFSEDLTIEKNQGGYIWPWGRIGGVRNDIQAEMDKEGAGSAKVWEWCERETEKFL